MNRGFPATRVAGSSPVISPAEYGAEIRGDETLARTVLTIQAIIG